MHTADTLEAGVLLYNVTGQKAILSVLMMLVSQGADYAVPAALVAYAAGVWAAAWLV